MVRQSRKATQISGLAVLAIAHAIAGGGCAGNRGAHAWRLAEGVQGPAWPASPGQPRIRFLGSIAGVGDTEAPSPLAKAARALFGRGDVSLVRPSGVGGMRGVVGVADVGAGALDFFDLNAGSHRRFLGPESDALVSPVGVAAAEDFFYLSDSHLGRVFRVDPRGRLQGVVGERELGRPTGIAVDRGSGRLFVADTDAHRIVVFDRHGVLERTIGSRGTGAGQFNYPTYLYVDASGRLYVVDSLNYRVQSFDADGHVLAEFGEHGDGAGNFASPKGIAMDSQGHLYVADALFDVVQIFDQSGRLLLTFGGRGTGPGQLWMPAGLYIDENDRIFVSDSYNGRVQVFQLLAASHEAP